MEMDKRPYQCLRRKRLLSEVKKMLSLETDALAVPKAQSQLFEATFELVSTALILLDGQGMVLKVNGAFGELLGYAAAELLGKPLLDILHPADRESRQALHGRTLPGCLTGSPLELHYLRKDGRLLRGRSKLAVVGSHLDSASLLLGEIIALDATPSVDQQLEQDQWSLNNPNCWQSKTNWRQTPRMALLLSFRSWRWS